MKTSRRNFILGAAGLGFGGLALYYANSAFLNQPVVESIGKAYGPLVKDPNGIVDLPEGFNYQIIARLGEEMSDGLLTPGRPDGMATFEGENGHIILIKNHELSINATDFGAFGPNMERLTPEIRAQMYDSGSDDIHMLGGTTTLIYDPENNRVVRQYLSLAGTMVNCCGGPTPWNSWLSCEETFQNVGDGDLTKDHGFIFEVPAHENPSLVKASPLRDMGKFNHEAAAVDPATGIIYLTEDREDGLFYRFVPFVVGQLAEGGTLQALAIEGIESSDTRNWEQKLINVGDRFKVRWIDLEDINPTTDDLRVRGHQSGAAIFARGEGMWFGDQSAYFSCTNGGSDKFGQIWKYYPASSSEANGGGILELFVESRDQSVMRRCDNMTIARNGHLFVCEDGTGNDSIRGVDPQGSIYTFAHNPYSTSEFAGSCFSPDGSIFFVNIQDEHLTLAIRGPWEKFLPI